MRTALPLLLWTVSNSFMALAWYGHLKFQEYPKLAQLGLIALVLISWGFAFFEYCFMIPANRMAYQGNGGPFSLVQMRLLQEVISLLVFGLFTTLLFKNESFNGNHLAAVLCLLGSVYFLFRN